jgi:hypothetical protein
MCLKCMREFSAQGFKQHINACRGVIFCGTCGIETKNHKFCSKTCAQITTNATHPRRKRKPLPICPCCGVECSTRGRTYCSDTCKTQVLLADWVAGKSQPKTIASLKRRYLYVTRGEKCEICGWCEVHPILGYPPLQIDHIDGNDSNHALENLRILCPNCHALTSTWGFIGRTHKK